MINNELAEAEVFSFLKDIENGKILLTPQIEPQHVFAGNVSYEASNGWKITIFNDANEWDYIDEIITNDGRRLDYDLLDEMKSIRFYSPSDDICWSAYGIPGYCQFRCIKCGKKFKYKKDNVYICNKCKKKL